MAIMLPERIRVAGALDAEDLARAAETGLALVVDLRDDGEPVRWGLAPSAEAALAAQLGVPHRRVPMAATRPGRAAFAALARALAGVAGATLVHCASGRRAAVAVAAVRGRAGGRSLASCAADVRTCGFELDAMPLLRAALAEYLERDAAAVHLAGDGLGI